MAGTLELAVPGKQPFDEIGGDTKRIVNPRVEIDTSPPFASVKEAVTRFGGSGSWIPLHVLRFAAAAAAADGAAEFDIDKLEEQAVQLEKDLILKENETFNILKELEVAKRFVEELKLNLTKDVSNFMESPDSSSYSHISTPSEKSMEGLSICPVPSPDLILTELNQAKQNLNKTTNDLAIIRSFLESLNKKMRNDKALSGKKNKTQVSNSSVQAASEAEPKNNNIGCSVQNLNFEAEQSKKMAEGATYEFRKAMSEIEQTKTSIKIVEMRLAAAKKMEEAARAVEAIALAERNALPNHHNNENMEEFLFPKHEGITLSYEEYSALTQKAKKTEELSKEKVVKAYPQEEETKDEKKSLGEALGRSDHPRIHFPGRNEDSREPNRDDSNHSNLNKDKSTPYYRSTISIGDILSRKLILQDDIHVESHTERREESFSRMLREQSGLIFHSSKSSKEGSGSVDKQYFTQKKKFGFIHVSLPSAKHGKRKS